MKGAGKPGAKTGGTGGIITLTTDFGLADPWVRMMKGVILSINPSLSIVDVTHEIPPQDVNKASFFMASIGRYFPEGTIHVCVVDPGVGSGREPVIIQTERCFYVGPNNGVFSTLDSRVKKSVVIKSRRFLTAEVSATFHGRDVFAPVAARLASTPVEEFGPALKKLVKLDRPRPRRRKDGGVSGEIIYFDRFGNAFTNIKKEMLRTAGAARAAVTLRNLEVRGVSPFYRAVPKGTPGAVINGFGLLEIFSPDGNALEEFGLKTGDRVSVGRARKRPR
ncbi:MAG: SAM-dependent chlorinase/fluorinase [Nitrospinae bacterium]|nr:SAM-dependent chlorinase/fluorinase [Nitrospinota bacterium]